MDGFDIIDPVFAGYVLSNAPLEMLGEGFRWVEGPVWFADSETFLFSDLPNSRVMRWTESGGMSVVRQNDAFENGHARDRQGRLVACSHRHRTISRTELDGSQTLLADHFEGRRLNSPNDVVVKSDGSIWFTDPTYGINTDYEGGKQTPERPPAVYRLDPADGAMTVVADDFDGPNGLCFSPDESRLYIAETGIQFAEHPERGIRVFDVAADGRSLSNGRDFHSIAPGFADGICCDDLGNIWSSAADGVHCISPEGKLLGKIKVPHLVSNLRFGGRNRSRLFICASHTIYAIYTNRRGVTFP